MKRLLCLLLLSVTVLQPRMASAELIDSIAAMVDQEIILVSEIREAIASQVPILRQNATSQEEFERAFTQLMTQALEEIIQSKILYREALRAGIEIHDADVENNVNDFRKTFEKEEDFMAYLNEAGVTLNSYRDRIRKQMMARYMSGTKRQMLESEVVISETDVTAYLDEHEEEFSQPERVRVRQIMIRARRDTPERDEAKARLELLRDEVRNGSDFGELAKRYSEAPGAEDGGIIGWQKRGDLVAEMDEAAFALEAGQVSEVVETQFGVHLLQVDDRAAAGEVSLTDARAKIEPQLRTQEASERFVKWINDLRKRSNVRVYL
jgi:parvulin-like peptidyl-prolyl isomerase